jgi:hypothetical protein
MWGAETHSIFLRRTHPLGAGFCEGRGVRLPGYSTAGTSRKPQITEKLGNTKDIPGI